METSSSAELFSNEEELFGVVSDLVSSGAAATSTEGAQEDITDARETDETAAKQNNTASTQQAPRLNEGVLCGETGLVALIEAFKEVTFKGDGNEYNNLSVLLEKYEFWAHQMIPRLNFNDVIERVEELGNKKAVRRKACILLQGDETQD